MRPVRAPVPWLRLLAAALFLGAAVWHLLYPGAGVDELLLELLVAAALALLVPWERLRHFKAGRFEATLDSPSVQQAVEELPRPGRPVDLEGVKAEIRHLEDVLPFLVGRRILWVDDTPKNNRGERRLLRSLGIHVTSTRSTAEALDELDRDDDYDLLVSDVGRPRSRKAGVTMVNTEIRPHKNRAVASLPVIFYSSRTQPQLEKFLERKEWPTGPVAACNDPRHLLTLVVQQLLFVRTPG